MNEDGKMLEAILCAMEVREEFENMTVTELTNPIQLMKEQKDSVQAINPTVFDATLKTMRWSGFFRYIKRKNPVGWENFLQQLAPVKVIPVVKTPTKLGRK
ncbi:hypothetical protein THIOM_003146 [Candidatus Thiomargarita nelsonii]|uniref:Uncharacterized protein n=1 Tax=Candidatus Thiomargarita nelsonii TaxID=1003181 RepID=A0A0A6P274_9GAMM|nr:hypothetical protein THIOM_003146 [Candidatus Thiomargarita nelsonii]